MADKGTIRIRIGAAMDRSIDAVFGQIRRKAAKARADIDAELSKQKGGGSPYRKLADDFDAASERIRKTNRRTVDDISKGFGQIAKVAEMQMRKAARERDRAVDRFATRTSQRATRFAFGAPEGAARYGARVGREILGGAGINLDVGASVGRVTSLHTQAVGLAQQERIATGKSRGAEGFVSMAREKGTELGTDPTQILGLLRNFTGKTGDFKAAEDLVGRLGKMSVAAGADLGEMGDAAGYVFNQLKDLPDAGDRTLDVMRNIVGQTAVGAVEMKDFATQMGRIAANAGSFEGDKGKNISKLGALAQLSIATGGATSAADAARAVSAFGTTFKTKARLGAFKKEGIDVFSDKSKTTIKDPFELIKESLTKTKGSIPKMAQLFSSVIGQKPVAALANVYKGAGGGEAGLKAVDAELDKYMKATLDAGVENENFAEHMKDSATKAQLFQNKLDTLVSKMVDRVLPAFDKLEPKILKIVDAFSGMVAWAAENPWKTVMAALAYSVARGGAESLARAGLESATKSGMGLLGSAAQSMGGAGAIGGAGGAGGGLAVLQTAGVIAIAAAIAIAAGVAVIDYYSDLAAKKSSKRAVEGAQDTANMVNAEMNGMAPGDRSKLVTQEGVLQRRIANAQKEHGTGAGLVEMFTGQASGDRREALLDYQHLDNLKEEMGRIHALLAGRTLKVEVTNLPPTVPTASSSGRQPPPGKRPAHPPQ